MFVYWVMGTHDSLHSYDGILLKKNPKSVHKNKYKSSKSLLKIDMKKQVAANFIQNAVI